MSPLDALARNAGRTAAARPAQAEPLVDHDGPQVALPRALFRLVRARIADIGTGVAGQHAQEVVKEEEAPPETGP